MSDTLARVLAGLALLGVLVNGVMLWRASGRQAAIDAKLEEIRGQRGAAVELMKGLAKNPNAPVVRGDATRSKKATNRTPRRAKAKQKRRSGRVDPEERQERRRAKVREALTLEIDDFAAAWELDEATRADVVDEVLLLREATVVIRDDIRNDRLTAFEGRAEMRAMREDSDERLIEILGPDAADALKQRFAAEWEERQDARGARRDNRRGAKAE
jgi:hypothetical protein